MADLILIGCVKSKQNCMRVAKDLYNSPLWRYRRAYAEQSGSSWYILSAEHGLLAPETEIEPYDVTLSELSASKRRAWSQCVLDELSKKFSSLEESVIEIHAGKNYVDYGLAQGLSDAGAIVQRPLARIIGIGRQCRWYRSRLAVSSRQ